MAEHQTLNSRSVARLFLESAVIVVSILIAFAIDVAWDRAQEREIKLQHVQAILTEMRGNLEVFDRHAETCSEVLQATRTLLSAMGPAPVAVSTDSLTRLFAKSFTGMPPGRSTLRASALNAVIQSGGFSELDSFELQQALTTWATDGIAFREMQAARYEDAVQKTIDYMTTVMPVGRLLAASRIDLPDSEFEVDVEQLLSDPTLEGVVTNLGILMGHICADDPGRRDAASNLVDLLEAELDR